MCTLKILPRVVNISDWIGIEYSFVAWRGLIDVSDMMPGKSSLSEP